MPCAHSHIDTRTTRCSVARLSWRLPHSDKDVHDLVKRPPFLSQYFFSPHGVGWEIDV